MSSNINQIYIANPVTTNLDTDLIYVGRSPYAATDDAAIDFADFKAQFALSAGSFTSGSVIFANASNQLTQNNAQFYWNNVNERLGVGTSTVLAPIHAVGRPATSTFTFLAATTTTTAGDPVEAFAANLISSVGRTSGYTSGHAADIAPNAGDTAGHFYAGFYAENISATGSSPKNVLYSGTGFTNLINSSSGNIVFTGYTANIYSTTGDVNLAYNGAAASGNVGIGKTSPAFRLDVSGIINSSNNIISGGFTAPTAQGHFMAWNRSATGISAFMNQPGSGPGGWEWLAYDVTNVLTAVSMTLSPTGNLVIAGSVTGGTWAATAVGAIYGGTGQTTYVLGDTLYSSATNVLSKLAGNITTAKQYLSQTGNGAVSAAPAWATISATDLGGILPLANGGTNANLVAANGAIPYSTATGFALLAHPADLNKPLVSSISGAPHYSSISFPDTITINTMLVANTANILTGLAAGNNSVVQSSATGVISFNSPLAVAAGGSGTSTAFTLGSVVFAGASGVYAQDNANFFWDDTNNRLGLGTASPGWPLTVNASAVGNVELAKYRNTAAINVGQFADVLMAIGADQTFGTRLRSGALGVNHNGFQIYLGNGDSATEQLLMQFSNLAGVMSIQINATITVGTWNGSVVGVTYGGTGTATNFTTGSVVFAGASGVYTQDNVGLFFNPTSNFLGIGTATPHSEVQLSNAVTNRKFVMFEAADNDHQFYGDGINAGVYRFQIAVTSASYIFYAATSTTTSSQLFQVTGLASSVIGNAAVATTATDGFLYITSCAGAPTGVPTAFTGRVATVYDSTSNRIYFYNGAWRSILVA